MIVITMARKPLSESTIANNILKYGTGSLNIDAGRVAAPNESISNHARVNPKDTIFSDRNWSPKQDTHQKEGQLLGRWPANVILRHNAQCKTECAPSCPIVNLDLQSGDRPVSGTAHGAKAATHAAGAGHIFGDAFQTKGVGTVHDDKGGASRFFKQVRGI